MFKIGKTRTNPCKLFAKNYNSVFSKLLHYLYTMHFVFPTFLYALIALSIPIIIHLFYFRKYKKLYFPDIRFLKKLQEQKSNINQLKQRLILLARLAAASMMLHSSMELASGFSQ